MNEKKWKVVCTKKLDAGKRKTEKARTVMTQLLCPIAATSPKFVREWTTQFHPKWPSPPVYKYVCLDFGVLLEPINKTQGGPGGQVITRVEYHGHAPNASQMPR